jgi:hypothetical protein
MISGTPWPVKACSIPSFAWQDAYVMATLWAGTMQRATSTTAARYTNPRAMGM